MAELIRDVKHIDAPTDIPISSEKDLEKIVEQPYLDACKLLFRKGIKTISAGEHFCEDSKRGGVIQIDIESLTPKNLSIFNEMCEQWSDISAKHKFFRSCARMEGATIVKDKVVRSKKGLFAFNYNEDNTVSEVSNDMVSFFERFEQQHVLHKRRRKPPIVKNKDWFVVRKNCVHGLVEMINSGKFPDGTKLTEREMKKATIMLVKSINKPCREGKDFRLTNEENLDGGIRLEEIGSIVAVSNVRSLLRRYFKTDNQLRRHFGKADMDNINFFMK